jgi:hypothetical protein
LACIQLIVPLIWTRLSPCGTNNRHKSTKSEILNTKQTQMTKIQISEKIFFKYLSFEIV